MAAGGTISADRASLTAAGMGAVSALAGLTRRSGGCGIADKAPIAVAIAAHRNGPQIIVLRELGGALVLMWDEARDSICLLAGARGAVTASQCQRMVPWK